VTDTALTKRRWRRWWPWIGGVIGITALFWVFGRIDYQRFLAVLAEASPGFVLLVPVAIAAEQLLRAWKWRQLLSPLRTIGVLRLFGAIMGGYFANLVIPVGASPIVRSWLVARSQGLATSAVLATVAIDRVIDGIVFTAFVPIVLLLFVIPDPSGAIRAGLSWGAGGSLLLFIVLLLALAGYRLQATHDTGWLGRCVRRLPPRLVDPARRLIHSFAEGIVWPREPWRRAGILSASVLIKLIAATHFLWAGLALGVLLAPVEYLFLLVFFGFLSIITHFARLTAGFTVGAVFALELLGVSQERALAMVLIVQFATLLTVTVTGGPALWRRGVSLRELRAVEEHDAC
jgi:uncharacterized membrane protein YbhN (UPF0104 family)